MSELACNIAIGLGGLDWPGVPLALIWHQLPELLSTVECATTADPFSRFLATELHLVNIYENHKNITNMSESSAPYRMFHNTAGDEKRHFFGRNMELRLDAPFFRSK